MVLEKKIVLFPGQREGVAAPHRLEAAAEFPDRRRRTAAAAGSLEPAGQVPCHGGAGSQEEGRHFRENFHRPGKEIREAGAPVGEGAGLF